MFLFYSGRLCLSVYLLSVKSALKGARFESVEAVKEKAACVLKELTEDDFQQCFQQWKIRMEHCRDRGMYIEDGPVSNTTELAFINKITDGSQYVVFQGDIHYYRSVIDMGLSCMDILENDLIVGTELPLGFDMEWPVDFRRLAIGLPVQKTALIQICPNETTCFLFNVDKLEYLPEILLTLIGLPEVKIVGLNIKNDILKLGRDFDLDLTEIIEENVVDIGVFANRVVDYPRRWSLEKLTKHCFQKTLIKDTNIRISDWSKKELSPQQKLYAATDAFISLLIYKHLKSVEKRRFGMLGLSFDKKR